MDRKTRKIVAYYRVSTWKQGQSGLGLEAQQKAVADYAEAESAAIVASFTEVESGRMLTHDRPELAKAIQMAKAHRALLCVAKLDRVGRKASDVLRLVDQPGLKVVFADSPNAKGFEIGIRAVVAEEEARAISERTKAALAAAKVRLAKDGKKLGNNDGGAALLAYKAVHGNTAGCIGARKHATQFADLVRPVIEPLITAGLSDGAIAKTLNDDEIPTRRDGGRWHETSVRRLRLRLSA